MNKKPISHSVETDGFMVEARSTLDGIMIPICGSVYGDAWKEILLIEDPAGIPGGLWEDYFRLAGCLSYNQANALAWGLKAKAEAAKKYGLSVRVVRYRFKASWTLTPDAYADPLPSENTQHGLFRTVEQ